MFRFFKRQPSSPPAPELPFHLCLNGLTDAIQQDEYFPRINWSAVHQELKRLEIREHLHEHWTSIAAQWLRLLVRHLQADYRVIESKNFLLMTNRSRVVADELIGAAEEALARLRAFYQPSLDELGYGKHVVLHFASHRPYYDYVSYLHQGNGEQATSGAVYIRQGYSHTAINGSNQVFIKSLIHELAHDVVRKRPIPVWLNEGFAQHAEEMSRAYSGLDRRRFRLHQRYWGMFGIQHFWSGAGFNKPSSQRQSYELARVLFRNLWMRHRDRERLVKFLKTATYKDAGEAACQECFDRSLGDLVAEFLGKGNWDFVPPQSAE